MVDRLAAQIGWLRRSSAVRLSLLISGVFAAGFLLVIFVTLELGKDALERRVDATLMAIASTAPEDGARGDTADLILRPIADIRDLPRPFRQVAQRGGGSVELERPFRRAEDWRVLIAPNAGGMRYLVALPMEDSEDALDLLAGILWTTAVVLIAVSLVVGLGAGLLAQRRLSVINATLKRLASGDLSARTGRERSRDDLDDIARQLDRTAAELEALVAQTRHLSASIAHDLRTPLARLRAQLEMLPDGEARGAALEEAGKLSAIFDTIMRVARIEAGQGRDGFETVDPAALLEDIADIFGPVVEDAGKTLTLEVGQTQSIEADRDMVVQAMANLIQNALVHGGSGITLFAQGRDIGVADNGPGVDPTQYDEIIKPMVRLDAARGSDGSGLGLALVRAAADRHGAELKLSPNEPQGLRVTLKFAKL